MRILSCDGGGIRGLLTAVWLERLERELGGPLGAHFDFVAGTSTGSFLACGVAAGLPARRIADLYRHDGASIFPRGLSWSWSRLRRMGGSGLSAPLYDAAPLEAALQRAFGARLFGELAPRTLVPTYDLISREVQLLRSWQPQHASLMVWDVCRASSAAPAYFGAHPLRLEGAYASLVDGGVAANDPAACALAEACRLTQSAPDPSWLVVSLGTGSVTRPILDGAKRGPSEWALDVIQLFMDGASDAGAAIARELLPDGRYLRWQVDLPHGQESMDDARPAALSALEQTALRYLESDEGKANLETVLSLLARPRAA